MHRMLLIAWAAALATPSTGPAQGMSAACAERDLQTITFIEQHGEAGDLSAATLGELGLMHMQARRICIAGQETAALAIYSEILSTVRTAGRVRP